MTFTSSTTKKKAVSSSTFKRDLPEWHPHEYQKKAMRFGIERNAAALFLDPGLGKTSITLGMFKVLRAKKLARRMLVIAPLRVCYAVWPAEAKKWKDFENLTVTVLHGPKKDKLKDEATDVHVINPEGLEWLLTKHTKRTWPYDVLVIDESTMFKRTTTQRFKLLKVVLPFFSRRYVLTGTPTPNGLLDLYGQIYVLDEGASLGAYFTHYRARHFAPGGFNGYVWKLVDGEDKKISERIKHLALRMDAKDFLDLKEPIVNIIRVDLPPKARAIYDQMEKEMFADLDAGRIKSVNGAVSLMKCRQIANGGLYIDAKEKTWQHIHDAKTEAVRDIIDELNGGPALVTYEFAHDLARLNKELGNPPSSASVKAKDMAKFEAEWKCDEHPVFLAQPASSSHGLNLQGGRAVVFHSLTYNYEHVYQLIRRVHRQGNVGRVVIHYIVARDTVDEAIYRSVAAKAKGEAAFVGSLKRYRLSKPSN